MTLTETVWLHTYTQVFSLMSSRVGTMAEAVEQAAQAADLAAAKVENRNPTVPDAPAKRGPGRPPKEKVNE